MRYKKKGEIAVFLAMLLSILCLFITRLIDNVKSYVVKTRIMLASDAAIRSCFAEYNKRLYESFHIMCIDPSYRTNENGYDMLSDHLITYINENIRMGQSAGDISDLYVSELYLVQSDKLDDTKLIEMISDYENCEAPIYSYACQKFGNGNNPRKEAVRSGEQEYLLYGYENDTLNINEAIEDYQDYIFEDLDTDSDADRDEEYYSTDSIKVSGHLISNRKHHQDRYQELSYEEYLQMRIMKEDEEELVEGIKELINEDLRANGSPAFSLDECLVGIEYIVDISDSCGNNYSISDSFNY